MNKDIFFHSFNDSHLFLAVNILSTYLRKKNISNIFIFNAEFTKDFF